MSLWPPTRRKGTNEKHKLCGANVNYTNLTVGDGITVGASFGGGASSGRFFMIASLRFGIKITRPG